MIVLNPDPAIFFLVGARKDIAFHQLFNTKDGSLFATQKSEHNKEKMSRMSCIN